MIFVSHQLENMWKHPNPFEGNNFLELVKTHNKTRRYILFTGRVSKPRPPKYEVGIAATWYGRFGVMYDSLPSWISELFVYVVSFIC